MITEERWSAYYPLAGRISSLELMTSSAFTALRGALRSLNPFRRATSRPHSFSPRPLDQHDYHQLMVAFSQSNDYESVLRILRRMKISNCPPDAFCYGTVIKALLASERPLDALSMFDEMLSNGITPTLHCYNLLVKVYACHLRRFDWARELLRWMDGHGFEPNVVTYSTLINGFCSAERIGDALDVFDEMLKRGRAPNQHIYAPLLKAYLSKGRFEEAKEMFESMRVHGCKPDVVIYNILIEGLCKIRDFYEVERLINTSKENVWDPDAVTYNTYIAGLCNAGEAQEALFQLDTMIKKGLKPTNIGLNILLESTGEQINVSTSRFLLESCEKLGFHVDTISYNTVMNQLGKKGRWVDTLNLFTDLFKKGLKPDTYTFNILISSLCDAGEFPMVKNIFGFKGFVPDTVTCSILINHYYKSGEVKELGFILNYLNNGDITSDMVTYSTFIDCLCRSGRTFEAMNFVRNIENGYPTEPVALLTYWLVRTGRTGDVLKLFEEMSEKGLVLENRVFDRVITGFCRKGECEGEEAAKMDFVLDKMLGIC